MPRVVHFEIMAKDLDRSVRFYREAFGWELNNWAGAEEPYWLATTGPAEQAGINGAVVRRARDDQAVVNTIAVDALEEAIAKVEKAGGKKVSGPDVIPNVGRFAYCADPDGVRFGLLEPSRS